MSVDAVPVYCIVLLLVLKTLLKLWQARRAKGEIPSDTAELLSALEEAVDSGHPPDSSISSEDGQVIRTGSLEVLGAPSPPNTFS